MIEVLGGRFDPNTHTYYMGESKVTGATEALSRTGLRPPTQFSSRVHAANFEYAGERGTAIHRMCELDDNGNLGTYDPNLAGYLEAWRTFKNVYQYTPDPDVTERPVVHVDGFGVTPDSAGRSEFLGGYYVVVERKTRALKDYDEFQVAAQRLAIAEMIGKDCQGGLVVGLHADGRYDVRQCRDYTRRRQLFLAAVAIANYQISMEDK